MSDRSLTLKSIAGYCIEEALWKLVVDIAAAVVIVGIYPPVGAAAVIPDFNEIAVVKSADLIGGIKGRCGTQGKVTGFDDYAVSI